MGCDAQLQRKYVQKRVHAVSPFSAWWGGIVCAIIAIVFGIPFSIYSTISASETANLNVSFHQAASDLIDGISSQLSMTVKDIATLRIMSYANENFTAEQFYSAVDMLDKKTGVAIAYIPHVHHDMRARFEARVRHDNTDAASWPLYKDFQITDYNATLSAIVRVAPRNVYHPFLYMWPRPVPSNMSIIGFNIDDIDSSVVGDPSRSIRTGRPVLSVLTSARVLKYPAQRGVGFYVPVYKSTPLDEADRIAKGTGIFAAFAKLSHLIDGARRRAHANTLQIFVFDISLPEGMQLLYSESGACVQNVSNVTPVYGLISNQTIDAVDRTWLVIALPKESLINEKITFKPLLYTGVFGVVSTIIFGFAGFAIRLIERAHLRSDQSEQKRRFLSEMVGYVNHEIRNPLNGIIGLVEHAAETVKACVGFANPNRELLAVVTDLKDTIRMCDLVSHVVNDVLDIRKLEDGNFTINYEPVLLRRVLGDVIAIVQPKLKKSSSLRLIVEPFDNTLTFLGDAIRTLQVLINLVTNAIKFSESGEIHVSATIVSGGRVLPSGRNFTVREGHRSDVAMSSQTATQSLRFEVRDTGRGIEEQKKSLLFKPFSQIDESPHHGGSGLGLYLCVMLVELMGGRIDFDSAYGVGSTFWFEIPLIRLSDTEVDGASDETHHLSRMVHNNVQLSVSVPVPRQCSSISQQGHVDSPTTLLTSPVSRPIERDTRRLRKHLVCDDDRINRMVLRRYLLTLDHCEVDEVENGQDAVDKAAVNEYDVIWMDMRMPGLDGTAATRQIKSNLKCIDVPIIGVTGDITALDPDKDTGMYRILAKPIKKADISDILITLA